MPAVDRQLLRIATYELLGEPEVPVAVVLDEAVELAKQYSTEDSGRFVNGVLSGDRGEVRPLNRRPMSDVDDAYEAAGVDYDVLDAAKRRVAGGRGYDARPAGRPRGASSTGASLGEPASVIDDRRRHASASCSSASARSR